MTDFECLRLHERAVQIRDEARQFIDTCKMQMQRSRSLQEELSRLSDEAMILKEECIAEKCKSLAILALTYKLTNLPGGQCKFVPSFDEDAQIALQMIDEIKRIPIADGNPLQTLRSDLLGLSYLPVSK